MSDRVLLHELNEAAGSAVTSLRAQVERLQRTIAVERGDAAQAPPGWRRSPWRWPEGDRFPVLDGDTLCCGCSRADAAAGRCHRVWAAHALARNGWRVILDGEELPVGGAR